MISSETTEPVQKAPAGSRLERYRVKADPAIAIISAFYLVLLLIPRVAITSLESSQAIYALDFIFWILIAGDLLFRIVLTSDHRDRLIRIGALALLCSGILVFFRESDTTRNLVRIALITVVGIRAISSIRFFFKLRSVFYIASAVVLIVLAFGASMTALEDDQANANIISLSDGLWWAVSTVSTVGYGDKFPVTISGRILATGLMFIGVALFSILTATLANSFASRAEQGAADQLASIHERLVQIERNQQDDALVRRTRTPRRPKRKTPAPQVGHQNPGDEEREHE